MSIPFNEIVMPDKPLTKEQIIAKMRQSKPYKPGYFYDGSSGGDQAHFELSNRNDDELEDVPF